MSSQDLSPAYYPSAATNGVHPRALAPVRPRQRYWLHALLFALTLASTTIVGARMQTNFDRNLPFFDLERDIEKERQVPVRNRDSVEGNERHLSDRTTDACGATTVDTEGYGEHGFSSFMSNRDLR